MRMHQHVLRALHRRPVRYYCLDKYFVGDISSPAGVRTLLLQEELGLQPCTHLSAKCLTTACVNVPAVPRPAHVPTLETQSSCYNCSALLSAPEPGAAQAQGPHSPRPRASYTKGKSAVLCQKCTEQTTQILVRVRTKLSQLKSSGALTYRIHYGHASTGRCWLRVCLKKASGRARRFKRCLTALKGQLSERKGRAASVWCIKLR